MPNFLELQSGDGDIIKIDLKVARMSNLLSTMLDVLNTDKENQNEKDEKPLPLHRVSSSILRKVIEWAAYHQDDDSKVAEEAEKRGDNRISSWDVAFLQVDTETLIEIIKADKSNYLNIKGLLNVACQSMANLIAGKTNQEFREMFKTESKYTPEELEKVCQENEWITKMLQKDDSTD